MMKMLSSHVLKCSTCGKQNVVKTLQVKYLLNVKGSEIIRSNFLSLFLRNFLRKPFFSYNFLFHLHQFKYGFANLQVKIERNYCQ